VGGGCDDGGPHDASNGDKDCTKFVGKPVNVTSGNMYLEQVDYVLPSVGPYNSVARSYNSNSTAQGLFGTGWSTAYDQSVSEYDTHLIRYNQGDGRAVYFYRLGTGGPLVPATGDVHAQLIKTGSGYTVSWRNGSVASFNSSGKLLSFADRNGNTTTLTYDTSGFLITVTDSFNRTLTLTPDTSGRITQISDALGTVASYSYGTNSTLSSVTYADSSGYTFLYDGNSRLTDVKDALNHVLEAHSYDSEGRATTSEIDGGLEHYSLNYVAEDKTEVTDGLGRVTKYTFDISKGRNLVTKVEGVCGCGGSETKLWAYEKELNVTSMTDALGHVISFTYEDGNLKTATDATGTMTYTRNQFGFVLTRTDQLGGVTTNTYDANGNLLTTTDALNHETTFTYDSHGHLLTVEDARNKTTTLTWDTSGRLSELEDALSNSTTFAYDSRGRITSRTNALSETTTFEYDAAGRPKKIIFPDTKFLTLRTMLRIA
jgi:YD repeat-containing protein